MRRLYRDPVPGLRKLLCAGKSGSFAEVLPFSLGGENVVITILSRAGGVQSWDDLEDALFFGCYRIHMKYIVRT